MDQAPEISLGPLLHRGKDCIALRFKTFDLNQEVRKIPGVKFSSSHRCWYVENGEGVLTSIMRVLKPIARVDDSAFRQDTAKTSKEALALVGCPPSYVEQLDRMRYSENTKKIYINFFRHFIHHFRETSLDAITTISIFSVRIIFDAGGYMHQPEYYKIDVYSRCT